MKTFSNLLVLSVLLTPAVFATGMKSEMKDSPCSAIYQKCESAGFIKGDNTPVGRDLRRDCKEPLLNGKIVAGVSADQEDINKCKKFKEDKKMLKEWKKENS